MFRKTLRLLVACFIAMQISFEQLLRGQHFHSGFRIAGGLLVLACGAYLVGGLPAAAAATTGGICASVVDMPSPFRHKLRELPAAWLLSSLVYLAVSLLHFMPGLLGPGIVILSFLTAVAACYGTKAIMIGFSGSFAIIMALGSHQYGEHELLVQAGWFTVGGGAYALYGLATARLLVFRTKRQIFAETSFELAQYMRLKAAFYEEDAPLESLYIELVRRQSVLVQKQQTAREFLFRDIKADRDLRLARLFIMQIDLFEHVIAGNTDYEVLQRHYSGSDILLFLRDLVNKIAKDIDNIAYTALRNAQARKSVKYKAEIFAVEHDLERLSHDRKQNIDALSVLIDAFDKIVLCTEKVTEIRRHQDIPEDAPYTGAAPVNLSLFISSTNYSPRVFLRNLNPRSLYFRYACRVATATACGLLIAWGLSNFITGAFSHSYWILMTIFVVLRPNFSMTVQRRTDRIIGSVCGSLLAAGLLYFSPHPVLLALCLFMAQVTIVTFLTINYRFSSAAASVLTLIQIHFLNPSVAFAFGERAIDTIVGALLAYVCCYIFPAWEYRSIPQLIQVLYRSGARYTRMILGWDVSDQDYRLARKSWLDSMAELAGAFDRMLREPKAKRRAVNETGRFITLHYLFGARMASIRTMLTKLGEHTAGNLPAPRLDEVREKIERLFAMAEDVVGPADTSSKHSAPGHGDAGGHDEASGPPAPAEPRGRDAGAEAPEIDPAVLQQMDYSEQNVVMLLLKQLDSALALAGEIRALEREFELGYKRLG